MSRKTDGHMCLQQGIRFSVHVDQPSRGYVLEVFDNHFHLPNLGPIGQADARLDSASLISRTSF